MKKWMLHMKKADFKELSEKFGIDPVVAKIMRNRGLESEEAYDMFLNGGWEHLYDPAGMKGIVEAAGLIKEKIEKKKSIRIIGDYDIDGVNASYILYKGLLCPQAEAAVHILQFPGGPMRSGRGQL